MLTPVRAPNANADVERFVRSIKEECLDRMLPMGERHFPRAVREFVAHYHGERNHQGLQNRLITGAAAIGTGGRVRRRLRLVPIMNGRRGTLPSRPSRRLLHEYKRVA